MWISEEPWISPWTENLSTDLSTAPGESASLINIIHRLDYDHSSVLRRTIILIVIIIQHS